MRIVKRGGTFLCMLCMVMPVLAEDYALDIDLKDALHSWRQATQEQADISELPKGVIEGDIYNTSYARAELQIAAPATDALGSTYRYIASRCDGQLAVSDVTTVFALTDEGQRLSTYLSRRGIIDDFTESEAYGTSCTNVVKCFYDETLTQIEKDNLGYDNTIRILCEEVVEGSYELMSTSVATLAAMQEINYGDDLLMNAKKDDGPFDILYDIEHIGNILFTHNDPATEIHFYDVQPPASYVDNDPDLTNPYETIVPNDDEQDPLRRLPATNGTDPNLPRSVYYDTATREPDASYTPPTEPTKDFSNYTDPSPIGGSPLQQEQLQEAIGPANELPSAASLHNPLCIEPEEEPEEEELDVLELAKLQQEHTYVYNKKLDLNTRVALASAAIMLPELEEQYGIDPVVVLRGGGIDPSTLPPLIDEEGLDGNALEAIKQGMVTCVEQFTEIPLGEGEEPASIDPDTVNKVVWKSITQPTALTKCIMDLLCFEVADDSGRGLYRIRGCTIPSRKAYGVVGNQKVVSIEEALDEFSNVCTSLQESGQLLEHNKTKDAWDHKLMRVKFDEKFSFSLSVGFKGLTDNEDPAYEKRMARENNAYLMDGLLSIDNNLGHTEQRNKYVSLYNTSASATSNGINSAHQNNTAAIGIDIEHIPGGNITNKEEHSQLHTHAASLDVLDNFIDLNTDYRNSINDTTHSIMQNRQAEMKESQQKG